VSDEKGALPGERGGDDLEGDLELDEIEQRLKVLERSAPAPHADYDAARAALERAAFPKLIAWLGPRGVPDGPDAREQLEAAARGIAERVAAEREAAPSAEDLAAVARALVADVLGYGPLQPFLDDPGVSEIMVNGPAEVVVERDGRLQRTAARFRDQEHLVHLIRKVAERIDRRIDYQHPTLDARLADGSRVHAVLPPVALDGPLLTIRKYGAMFDQIEDLVQSGTLRPEMAYYLGACVKARLNIAIGGASASGKTTTLNVLCSQIPPGERVVTIEELAELDLSQAHGGVVRLQARMENVEGAGLVTIRDLVREALRMRADRIIVGESRGEEMVDVLQAMRCGHDGSMTTIHASAPEDLVERAVTIALFGDVHIGETSLRRMVIDALDVLVIMARFADGQRKIVRIVEPSRDAEGGVHFHEVFRFDQRGYEGGRVRGTFRQVAPSRHGPRFEQWGISVPEEAVGDLG